MPGQKRFARTFGSLFLLSALLILSLAACGTGGGGNNGNSAANSANGNISTPTPLPTSMDTPTPTATALTVLGVDMAVSPQTLSGYACGANVTVTYTATFHFPVNNPGGQVAFQYTTDNGRGDTQDSLTVQPGQTSVPYKFTWSGALPADHTMPEPGGVIVTAPNSLTSALVGPSGTCSAATAAFAVTSVAVTAGPSLSGQTCGSQFTETYTATFHIAPNGPGGTITFTYTTDNGRSNSQSVNLQVAAGQTVIKSKFYWKGTLPADHTEPGVGIVLVTAPNAVTSTGGVPTGMCS